MKKSVILTLAIILLAGQISAFEFCEDGAQGENNLRIISVDDMLKENSKEWTWQSLQEIEIEIRVENKNDDEETYMIEAVFKDGDRTIRIADDSDDLEKEFSLSANERESISLTFKTEEDLDAENYDLYIKFYKESDEDEECVENSEEKIEIEKIEICPDENVDEDELELSSIEDETDDNENEWEWAPGNNIEISLELENKDYSEREFVVELIFLDENNEEIILADDSGEVYEEINLEENEKDDITFNFRLKSDIEEAEYTLYAKAYDAEDEDTCTSLKAEDKSSPKIIDIKPEERKVIITEVKGPANTTTLSQVQYTTTITNLGSEDEESVLAIAYNFQLDIKEKIEIKNLESGETRETIFNISIPTNISLQKYAIEFSTEYEYNEIQDHYKKSSDVDDDIKYYVTITQGEEEVEEEVIIIENETVIEKNETIATETPETNLTTIITGNVIGTPNDSPSLIIIIILIILAITGIVLFFKKPSIKEEANIEAPRVIRRYTAKLD